MAKRTEYLGIGQVYVNDFVNDVPAAGAFSQQSTRAAAPAGAVRRHRAGSGSRARNLVGKVVRGYSLVLDVSIEAQLSADTTQAWVSFSGNLRPLQGIAAKSINHELVFDDTSGNDPLQNKAKTWRLRGTLGSAWLPWNPSQTVPTQLSGSPVPQLNGQYDVPLLNLRVLESRADTTIPMFRITDANSAITSNVLTAWLGPVLSTGAGSGELRASAVKLDLVVSDPPTWGATSTGYAAMGVVPRVPTILLTAEYSGTADTRESVVGLSVTARSSGGMASVSANGVAFGSTAVAITDATGSVGFYVRGERAGVAVIDVYATDPVLGALFSPPLAGHAELQVYETTTGTVPPGGDTPPSGEPIGTTPGVGAPPVTNPATGCVVHPAQTFEAAVPARVDVTPVTAWDAGANSVDELDGNVSLRFPMAKVVGAVIGLTPTRGDVTDHERLTHGLYFFQTPGGAPRFQVIEGPNTLTSPAAYLIDDEFEIRRADGAVTYWHAGTKVYTSRVPSAGLVLVGCSMFATGDALPTSGGEAAPDPVPSGDVMFGGYFSPDAGVPSTYTLTLCSEFVGATTLTVTSAQQHVYYDLLDCGLAFDMSAVEAVPLDHPLTFDGVSWGLVNMSPGYMGLATGDWAVRVEADDASFAFIDLYVP